MGFISSRVIDDDDDDDNSRREFRLLTQRVTA